MNRKKISYNRNTLFIMITIILFVVMYTVGCVVYADKGFGHLQTLFNILTNNAGLICVACGMTAVMITGGIDISVGSLIALDCMIIAVGLDRWKMDTSILLLIILLIGVVFGIVQGWLVGYLGIQPFIVTMGGMFFARGMTAVICTDQVSVPADSLFSKWANSKIVFQFGGYVNKKGAMVLPFIRIEVVIALLIVVLTFIILRCTRFGRNMYAVGGNAQSAEMMGLNVKRIRLSAYVFSSILCSLGGICFCLNTMSGSVQQARGLEMDAVASAVIGGTLLTGGVGNVIGTFFGVLIIGTISTLVKSNGKLLSSWSSIATAALLCFFIVFQSVLGHIKTGHKKE